jgi:hypothetical protein
VILDEMRHMDFASYLKMIRVFTDEELILGEGKMVRDGHVPPELVERMALLGLFGITLPREYGGLAWTVEEQVLLTLEFTRASCVYRSRFSTTIGLCSQLLLDHGTEAQREMYLPKMAAGECVSSFALTEPEAGSDAGNMQTSAVRDKDSYVLNGHKRYITNGAWADLLVVFARAELGPSVFLVARGTPGVSTRLPERMNGHEAGPVAEIELVDVRVSADNLVGGEEGMGLRMALRGSTMPAHMSPLRPSDRPQGCLRALRNMPRHASNSARLWSIRVQCRPCSAVVTPNWPPAGPLYWNAPARSTGAPSRITRSLLPSCIARRWPVTSPTVQCKSSVGRPSSGTAPYLACGETCALCVFTKAHHRYTSETSPATW